MNGAVQNVPCRGDSFSMRLVTFQSDPCPSRIGVVISGNRVVDLQLAYALHSAETKSLAAADAIPDNMRAFFEGGERCMDAAKVALEYAARASATDAKPGPSGEKIAHDLNDVRLHAPILPKKFLHTAGNFREHHEEAQKAGFSHPVLPWIVFFQNVDAIIGPDDPIVYPSHLTQELDYELELAVVVKKAGKHFTAAEAPDYIGGYVIFNDITARDIQRQEMKSGVFSFCKGIDTFCPLGPWIVTPDEIPNPQNLSMELRVNGEVRQTSHTRKMSVTIPEILAHYSAMGYSAGDVVSTGTVSGVAAFSDDPKAWYLKPGDVVECEIEKIGVLRNPVISWEQGHGTAPPVGQLTAAPGSQKTAKS
jgi:2-keto-4-pentenoate hydratase/2-oxohepta-3-ene-1,7-dioic acid hydratase in catechol pathway